MVLVSAVHWPLPGELSPKFNHRYYGPYEVLQSFNGVTYKLKLPSSVKVHDTFHVSLLKRFHADKHWSQKTNLSEEAEKPEAILKQQVCNGTRNFLSSGKGDHFWKPHGSLKKVCFVRIPHSCSGTLALISATMARF